MLHFTFRCNQCDRRFAFKNNLDDHTIKVHTKVRNFFCSKCPKAFHLSHERAKHEKCVHWNASKLSGTSTCYNIRTPIFHLSRIVHLKELKFPCPHCPKLLPSNCKRETHILAVHTEDSAKPYQCSYCSKGFALKAILEDHENTHTNARPHLCPVCTLGFNNQATRNAHVKNKHPEYSKPSRGWWIINSSTCPRGINLS